MEQQVFAKSANSAMVQKALKVALLVGTILLCINQYDALLGHQDIKWPSAILTYCVPFFVFLSGQRSNLPK